jgi:hypothetical protein
MKDSIRRHPLARRGHLRLRPLARGVNPKFTCVPNTKVQIVALTRGWHDILSILSRTHRFAFVAARAYVGVTPTYAGAYVGVRLQRFEFVTTHA